MALKISLGLFFARIMVTRTNRYINYATITYSTVICVYYTFFNIFQCGGSFGVQYAIKSAQEECVSFRGKITAALVHGVSMAMTDFVFVGVALNMLRTSIMPTKQKVTVGGILVLAIM
jgi:hypothetical protein